MTRSSVVVHCAASGDVPFLEAKSWRDALLGEVRNGLRLVTLSGHRREDEVALLAVLQKADGALALTRTSVSSQFGYHELTSSHAAFQCFERELHEQTGVRIAGHPWLKPLRFEGKSQAAMNAYPFYKIEGKEVHEVAVGPIHAGVIEPGSFRFMCLGETVHHLEIQLGYQHRGVEARLLRGDPLRLAPLVETIAGDTSAAHAWAYCAAVEALGGCELDLDTEIRRAVMVELERVAMHLAGLSGLAADIGFLQGATTYGRLRTTAINTTMRLCGSRFGRTAIRPGGAGVELTPAVRRALADSIQLLQRDVAIINGLFLEARTVRHRLRRVGVLTKEQVESLGIVGVAARASGVDLDLRQGRSDGAYAVERPERVLCEEGDCWARARVRILEIDASLKWLAAMSSVHPSREGRQAAITALAPDRIVVTMVEGWRGEVVHCLETDGDGRLVRYKVQDPSLRNWMGLALAVRGNEISDFPICNKSFDLSYCGSDL